MATAEVDDAIEIAPLARPVDAIMAVPGSKSLTNRALLIAALARGRSLLTGGLASEDTAHMAGALRLLGVAIDERQTEQGTDFSVIGTAGHFRPTDAVIDIGASGTAARFLTAALPLGEGRYLLDGVARMHERPIEPLLVALRQLGADARTLHDTGCPPVVVEAAGLPGEVCAVRGDISSQYLSALLMIGPYAGGGATIRVDGPLVSRPFVRLTTAIMADFGLPVIEEGDLFRVPPGPYRARDYAIEPDATAASYFFAAAALTGGRVRVPGLGQRTAQGDLAFVELLARMGCLVEMDDEATVVCGPARLRGIEVDIGPIPDTAQTLAAIAPFASSPVTIHGLAQARVKETDRPAAVATELRRLGGRVDETHDSLTIYPAALHGGTVQTYGDHRMAMSFALIGLRVPGIRIADPRCVAKTFPDFFTRFARLGESAAPPAS